jgi:hypothetical protein
MFQNKTTSPLVPTARKLSDLSAPKVPQKLKTFRQRVAVVIAGGLALWGSSERPLLAQQAVYYPIGGLRFGWDPVPEPAMYQLRRIELARTSQGIVRTNQHEINTSIFCKGYAPMEPGKEYAFHVVAIDPKGAVSDPSPELVLHERQVVGACRATAISNQVTRCEMTFIRPINPANLPRLGYGMSTNGPWAPVTSLSETVTATNNAAGTETVSLRADVPINSANIIYLVWMVPDGIPTGIAIEPIRFLRVFEGQ